MTQLLTLLKVAFSVEGRWAVGLRAQADAVVQLPVLQDPRHPGRPYLPATGLTGSLRRSMSEDLALIWLGPEPEERERRTGTLSQAEEDRTGRLRMLGCLPVEAAVKSRGATSVDLQRGAAADNTHRIEQWVDPTDITLVAWHEGAVDEALVTSLSGWRPIVGRARTAGLGRARVTKVETLTLDLANPDQLHWWLTNRDGWLRGMTPPVGVQPQTHVSNTHRADEPTWTLTAAEPIHVGIQKALEGQTDGRTASPSLTSNGHLIIPGSAWKGVFRHRTEVILNALDVPRADADAIVGALYGSQVRRGRLAFSDSVTTAIEGDLRTHVAIDRFTGGARDSALHRLRAIPEGSTIPLTIRLDGGHPVGAIRNLLEHIVNDLDAGLATVGGHGTRGYGWVQRQTSGPMLEAVDAAALHSELELLRQPAEPKGTAS